MGATHGHGVRAGKKPNCGEPIKCEMSISWCEDVAMKPEMIWEGPGSRTDAELSVMLGYYNGSAGRSSGA